MTDLTLAPDTLAVHAGRDDLTGLGVHALPLDLSSTYPLGGVEVGGDAYEALAGGGTPEGLDSLVYQRLWNPTVARFEAALAVLEHCAQAVAFGSGMAAIGASIQAAMQQSGGRHVVALRPLYGGTDHVLATGLYGTETTFCRRVEEVADAVRADTCLVIAETPANPTLELVDLRALVAAAGDAPVLVDNTFATPVLQNPADFGVAMVMHSATKYLGGHGDVIGGVIAGSADWCAAIRRVRALTGALAHPLAAYLSHRGLATLPVRLRAQQEGAKVVAGFLAEHDAVARVHYPGLPDGDPHGLVGTQMRGPGAMLAIDLRTHEAAARLVERVRLFTHAVSLGGVDSLIQHPAALTHRPVAPAERPGAGVVRLSIGLEDPADLVTDLDRALT
ncbi:trans-sulfuration enzyme family protein [Mariniluteicoccus flavus]